MNMKMVVDVMKYLFFPMGYVYVSIPQKFRAIMV